jgi:hypothetical protein
VALPSVTCDSGCVRLATGLETGPDSASLRYAPTESKRGAIIGAIAGTALGVLVLTQCDSDAHADCPGWGRAVLAFGVSTGAGALIGAMFKQPP